MNTVAEYVSLTLRWAEESRRLAHTQRELVTMRALMTEEELADARRAIRAERGLVHA